MKSKFVVAGIVFAAALVMPGSAWALPIFAAPTNFAAGDGPQSVAISDLNGDGDLDLAVANFYAGDVSVLLGAGDGTFGPPTNVASGGNGPSALAVADFDNDSDLDLAVTNSNSAAVGVLLNNGDGTFAAAVLHPTGSIPTDVATGDFNGDGDPDLAIADQNSGTATILLGGAGSAFNPAAGSPFIVGVGSGPRSIAVGDLDADNDLDLAVAGTSNVFVLLGTGTGTFGAPAVTAVGGTLGGLALGDLNGDSDLDLAVSIANSGIVVILPNDGAGGFLPPAISDYYDVGSGPVSVAIADLDGDGDLDVVTPNQNDGNVGVLDGNGDGTFAAQVTFPVGALFPSDAAVDDLNGDTKLDLVTANIGSGNVSVLVNDPSFTTGPTATISGTVRQGQTLTADEGTPDPTPDSFSYQWLADGGPIGGATAKTFQLTSAQVGKKISVTVTAHKTGFNDASDTSPETVAVVGVFTPGPNASISGYPRIGSTLTANAGSPSPTPTKLVYRWYANGSLLPVTTRTLKLTTAHYGKPIHVKVYAVKPGYLTASDLSPGTARVSNLQAKTISLELNDYTLRRGQRVYADIERLAPGEAWSIILDGKKLAAGKASSKGTALTGFTVPANAVLGQRIIRANGAFPDRTDPDRITVR